MPSASTYVSAARASASTMPIAPGAPQNTVITRRATVAGSAGAASLTAVPAASSATTTHSVQRSSSTGATRTPSTPRSARPTVRWSAASCSKSSSATARSRTSRISGPTSSAGNAVRTGAAIRSSSDRSDRAEAAMPGRPTLTRTGVPSRTARWVWAWASIASGCSSSESSSPPVSRSTSDTGIRHDVSARAEAMAAVTWPRTRSGRCSGRTTPSRRATAACTVRDRPATSRAVS